MIEFDKWFAQITKEYPLYQDGEGYNIGNTRALMVGWRAALRMVLIKTQSQQSLAHYRQDLLWGLEKDIKKELEE